MRQKFNQKLYENIALFYDHIQNHMVPLKEEAVKLSRLSPGDTVLIYCCGTGLEIPSILNVIGDSGKIIAVDYSVNMLKKLEEKQKIHNWTNLTLYHGDVTKSEIQHYLDKQTDTAFCTLGLSVIPEYEKALDNLVHSVKKGGNIVISDTKLRRGNFSFLYNIVGVGISYFFGSSYLMNKNSDKVIQKLEDSLSDVKIKEYLSNTYFIASGIR